ncbi:MAG: hypothetical protein JHC95_02745 [Solirubrobacteraceae bacterium]|nr:hypothetical protein [Solirubrobacteraceae bacterium]
MRLALALVAVFVLAGCAADEDAPPTEALALPEAVRVIGHSYECPVTPEMCRRYLLIAPSLEADPPLRSSAAVRDVVWRGMLAAGWRPTPAASADDRAARSTKDGAFAAILTDPDWSDLRLGPQLQDLERDRQPIAAVALSDDRTN